MKYEPVIGLEVHIELNTKSKMFCRCSTDYFGQKPNTHVCPICLGLPGALPYINEKAIEDCLKIGLALNCSVNEISRFERKNYFYPDLPKGYQISQYRWPLCVEGWLLVVGSDGKETKIRINRVHQEEDTGKLTHIGKETWIDFNRCGVPLVEIVTEPDFHDSKDVRNFAKKLQQLFRYLDVSRADMERGDMRLEANVSVRPEETDGLPNYRIELKNINSFRFMMAAIEYEIKRQTEALEKGEKLIQETRGWDEDKRETYLQRSKEEAHDYRYFPDPDLPELRVEASSVKRLVSSLPEPPWDKEKRFVTEYGLSGDNAGILTESAELAEFYESVVKLGKDDEVLPKQIANLLINLPAGRQGQKVDFKKVSTQEIISQIKNKGLGIIGDEVELEKLVREAIKENSESAEAFQNGKLGALNVLLGAVMKKTSGKAEIGKVKKILENLLQIGT